MRSETKSASGGTKIGFLFPGQASQYIGMGKEFFDNYNVARETFEQANDILSFDLKKYIFEGDETELRKTAITQPAIFTVSVATLKVFMERYLASFSFEEVIVAGHSLGEYSALFAANVFDFPSSLALVNQRGKFIQEASEQNPGKMAAIIGLKRNVVEEICNNVMTDRNLVVEPVNFNSSQQIVIAGHSEACEKAVKIAQEKGAKRAVILNVSGAFHSKLMSPARDKFAAEVERIELKDAKVPIVTNYNARLNFKAGEIKRALIEQIDNPILWEESILKMIDYGVNTFIEIGPGKVLSNLLRRTLKNVEVLNVENQSTLEKTLDRLKNDG